MTSPDLNKELISAAKAGDLEEVRRLVAAGADMNWDGDIPSTFWAFFKNHMDVVRYLLENGANVNYDGFGEGTLLTLSAHNGEVEFMKYLFKLGADVNVVLPRAGETALHHAANKNRTLSAKLLIERGIEVNRQAFGKHELSYGKPFVGETALHVAATRCDTAFIQVLLDGGADKTIQTQDGRTAYDFAVERNKPDEIQQLLAP
jgi:ankyrin repeat protein